jgi:ferredoxin
MRIAADRERCIGSGQCVLTEDRVFEQSEGDGRVVLLTEAPEGDEELTGNLRYAVLLCPSQALRLDED